MLSFTEFLEERKVDPEALGARAARIHGKKTRYGSDFDEPVKGKHIPLKSYNRRKAESMWNKYEQGGHTSVRNTLPISSLTAAQPYVRTDNPNTLKAKVKNTNPQHISIATHRGVNYIVDGHHAVLAARLRGEKHVEVNHYNLDNSAKNS